MHLDEFLRPELVCCRVPGEKYVVLRLLIERVATVVPEFKPDELLEAINKREKLGSTGMGKGLAFCHVRSEKVKELVVALATVPAGVKDWETPDGEPVKVISLFVIPKKHSDLYLRIIALLATSFSDPAVLERAVNAAQPQEVLAMLAPVETGKKLEDLFAQLMKDDQNGAQLTQVLDRFPPVDLAPLVEDLAPAGRTKVLQALDPHRAAQVTRCMHMVPLVAAMRRMPPEAAARILGFADRARAADVLQRLSSDEQAGILKYLDRMSKEGLQTLLKYPQDTAGGIMTPDVLSVGEEVSVSTTLKVLPSIKDRRQTDVFVTTEDNRLIGKCTIHDLLGANPEQKIGEIMDRHPDTVAPEKRHEELRHLAARKKLHSLPVVGLDGKLLGVVTQEHLLEALEHEAGEEIGLMLSGARIMDPLHTPIHARVKSRLPWLLLTLGGELVIALVISAFFKPTIEKAVVLVGFIPAITATGGNIGLQATAVVVRGLAMGTLRPKHAYKIIAGEMKLGILLGLMCGVVAAVVAYLINWHYAEAMKLSMAVFLAMASATLATSLVGTLEPLVLHKLKFDPATACGPFVTMFNDVFGSTVFMFIAMLMNFTPPPGK